MTSVILDDVCNIGETLKARSNQHKGPCSITLGVSKHIFTAHTEHIFTMENTKILTSLKEVGNNGIYLAKDG